MNFSIKSIFAKTITKIYIHNIMLNSNVSSKNNIHFIRKNIIHNDT